MSCKKIFCKHPEINCKKSMQTSLLIGPIYQICTHSRSIDIYFVRMQILIQALSNIIIRYALKHLLFITLSVTPSFKNYCSFHISLSIYNNFSFIRQKTKNFPIDPIIKSPTFVTSCLQTRHIDMTLQTWAIFIMGVYGEISHFLSDPTERSTCRASNYQNRPSIYGKK